MWSVLECDEMRTSVTLQVLLFAAGAAALAQSPGTFTPAVNPAYPDIGGGIFLPDGRIFYRSQTYNPGSAIYDPASGTLSAVSGNLFPSPGAATQLADGRILITESDTVRAELYDPVAQTFTLTGNMTAILSGAQIVLLSDGRVLFMGWYTQNPQAIPVDLTPEIYDPASGTFSAAGTWPGEGAAGTATLLPDGTVLVTAYYSGDTAIYDPIRSTFTPLNFTLYSEAAILLASGKVLFVSGIDDLSCGGGVPGGQLPLYDPISKTFRLTAGKTQAGQIQESVTLLGDGTVLLAGGWICPGNSTAAHEFGPDNRAQIYDPVTDTFTATENMTNGRSGCCGPLLPDGTVLLAGGDSSAYPTSYESANAEIYHPADPIKAPALFTNSTGQAVVWNSLTGALVSPGGAFVPAHAGDILSTYTNNLIEGGALPPQVSVGGKAAKILYFGDAPGYSGYFQVNFQVPGVTAGSSVPVVLSYIGRSSNAVTIGIQ
jgi:hypothetical protein